MLTTSGAHNRRAAKLVTLPGALLAWPGACSHDTPPLSHHVAWAANCPGDNCRRGGGDVRCREHVTLSPDRVRGNACCCYGKWLARHQGASDDVCPRSQERSSVRTGAALVSPTPTHPATTGKLEICQRFRRLRGSVAARQPILWSPPRPTPPAASAHSIKPLATHHQRLTFGDTNLTRSSNNSNAFSSQGAKNRVS